MSISVRARFDVRDGRQDEFEEVALALRDQAAEEPGTHVYRWFSAGAGSYLVLEEYADGAAALAHNARGADLLARMGRCAEMVHAELYGPIGPELAEWVESHPQAVTFAEFPGHGTGG
ncbi:putative quinol monooxygenase [Streptomyces sp. ISL-11]|uniref:putative quinol monooxygenase n=1 Tax=Streptomyces sp. ISL-11 TaxID=2819174 RepID=UPI001BE924CB|nr:antibiotic biosynthesis monooxygenase family protein [Streptomyces sp. ISL-11]MBT2386771.1 antibiotic biosynthesis monooxygenase [Streptomyces sp. ISL-11]